MRKPKVIASLALLALFLALFTLALASPSPHQLERSVMANAGTAMTSPSYQMNSTLGQPSPVGFSQGAHYQLWAGYWHSIIEEVVIWIKTYLPVIMKNFPP